MMTEEVDMSGCDMVEYSRIAVHMANIMARGNYAAARDYVRTLPSPFHEYFSLNIERHEFYFGKKTPSKKVTQPAPF